MTVTPKQPATKALMAILLSLLAVAIVVDMTRVEMNRTETVPPLPEPVTNNAVVSLTSQGREFLISFAGLGPGKGRGDTHARTFVFDSEDDFWREAAPVPGVVGRLAATAIAVGELAYVFGGYSVAADGSEVSTPWLHAFDPVSGGFTELSPIPVPVDDAVAVAYLERYIYLISGWHDFGNVNLVQRYDIVEDQWRQATPTPGRPVFGHAGGIVGNTIVYCDGVAIEPHESRQRDFVANAECFAGIIDDEETRRIDWREIKPHPGKPRYRMAAAGMTEKGGIVFIGGSDNPYNYDGIGYNGEPSSPVDDALLFTVETNAWQQIDVSGPATMDHRGLVLFEGGWVTVGGMGDDQQVTDDVNTYTFD